MDLPADGAVDAKRYVDMVALNIDPGVPLLNPDQIEHALTREPPDHQPASGQPGAGF